MIAYLIGLIIVGLIVGALARLIVPGPDPIGLGMTILIGIGGSFIAGLLVRALHGTNEAGFILSVLCAAGLVYATRRSRGPGVGTRVVRPVTVRRRYRRW
jgi:uncharacterized membrane protein YeaQ/YmgE (transglycosylase-associated protein family)